MTTYPDDEDGAVLAELAAQGVDMSRPLLVEFIVAVPDEAAAENCLQAMTKAGYDARIEFDEGEPDYDPEIDDEDEFGPSWTVYASVPMIPEYQEIVRIQAELDQLARPFGGMSDGWGVMLDDADDDE
jgi:hypothetical protein